MRIAASLQQWWSASKPFNTHTNGFLDGFARPILSTSALGLLGSLLRCILHMCRAVLAVMGSWGLTFTCRDSWADLGRWGRSGGPMGFAAPEHQHIHLAHHPIEPMYGAVVPISIPPLSHCRTEILNDAVWMLAHVTAHSHSRMFSSDDAMKTKLLEFLASHHPPPNLASLVCYGP